MMQTNRLKYAPRAVNHVSLDKLPIIFRCRIELEKIVSAGHAEQKLKLLLIVVVSSSVVINLWR